MRHTHVDRSGDSLSVSKMVEQALPLAAPARLNRVPLAGVAGRGSCERGAGAGGDAPAAAGDAPGRDGDITSDGDAPRGRAAGAAADDALGARIAAGKAGTAGEEAGEEAEALAGLGSVVIISGSALEPAAIRRWGGVRSRCMGSGSKEDANQAKRGVKLAGVQGRGGG